MSSASNYVEDLTLDFWLKANSQTTTAPATVYVGLFNSDPSTGSTLENLEAGTLTDECSGGGYARKAITFGTITNGSVSNSANVTFDPATDDGWGTVTHIAILDSATTGAGNVLFYGALDTAKQIASGDTFQITASNATVTLA